MEFDLGHGYQDAVPEDSKLALWVFGVLDEFSAIGLVEVAGDSPLPNRESRALYRRLRDSGYKPGIAEVSVILRKHMIELATPEFLQLFQTVINDGMQAVKDEVAKQKAEDARNAKIRQNYGYPDDVIPL